MADSLPFGSHDPGTVTQAIDIKQGVAAPRIAHVHAFHRHGQANEFRDTGPGRSAAEKQKTLIGQFLFGYSQCGIDPGQRYTCGPLDIVIVRASPVAIARQDRNRVDVGEILPLDAALRIQRLHRRDKLVDESHVVVASDARLAQPDVQRIIDQFLVVRADIQNNR